MNGVTITNNGNGTYTLNGTATSTFHIGILWDIKLSGQYKLIGCPEGGSEETYRLVLHNTPFSWATVDYGNGTVFNINETCHLQLYINAGVPLNNLIFKPMITNDLSATYDNFVSFDNSLVTGANSDIKIDLLWENASPMSSFSSQTLEVNSLGYEILLLEMKGWYGNNTDNGPRNGGSETHLLLKTSGSFHISQTVNKESFERYGNINNFQILFSDAYLGSSILNDYVIPLRIYGIK